MLGVLCWKKKPQKNPTETELTSFLASVRLLLVEMATFLKFLTVFV